eukprot:5674480-Amphidinium_carterae.1
MIWAWDVGLVPLALRYSLMFECLEDLHDDSWHGGAIEKNRHSVRKTDSNHHVPTRITWEW